MTKRPPESDHSLRPKRRKTPTNLKTATESGAEEHEIRSSRDLQTLLAFDQDHGPVPRQSKDHQKLPLA